MVISNVRLGPSFIRRWPMIAAAALALAAGPPLAAQTGTITGTVRNAANNSPLVEARVAIPALGMGQVTNNVGRYLLPGVPPGTHTLEVTYIGYASQTMEVTVAANGAATADFLLESDAISLEGIVVTGTAGAARRREVGNSVSQITEEVFESQPITRVADALQGNTLGVVALSNGGQVGAGSTIKLRGNNSVSFSNSPLIYVDGVRMRERGLIHSDEANQQTNPFDDINWHDVERMEIIKGAAATTLYGTEASGGVIQLFTKRGAAGAPAWSLAIDQGINSLGHIGPEASVNPTGLGLNNCNFTGNADFPGGDSQFPADPSCPASGSWLKNGHVQNYNLSVRGGAERMNYYLSARWGREGGVFDTGYYPETGEKKGAKRPEQGQESWNLRGNFAFAPAEGVDVRLNTYYAHRNVTWVPDGNNAEGLLLNVFRGGSDYTNDEDGKLLDMDITNVNDHFITGLNIIWNADHGITHRINTGIDWTRNTYLEERPWGYFRVALGDRESDERTFRKLTLDYSGAWLADLFGVQSEFSWGAQLYNDFVTGNNGFGEDFSGPGAKVVNSGAITEAFETNQRVTTGGFFFQERVGVADRLFVTAGLRVDGHSAFGSDFGLQPYPKASVSYVISDEDFFPEYLGTLKLRTALGESGKAPGLFDAVRTWASVAGDDGSPGLSPSNLGNSELGPERTREWEIGLEGSMVDGRVSYEYNYYNQNTFDALIPVTQPASQGFANAQFSNVGEIQTTGHEIGVNATVLATEQFVVDAGVRLSTNNSKVLDLGGLTRLPYGWRNYVHAPQECTEAMSNAVSFDGNGFIGQGCTVGEMVYYPLPVFCEDRVQNPNEVAAPVYADQCLGNTSPTRTIGWNAAVTFADRVTMDMVWEAQGGHWLSSGTAYQNARRRVWPTCRATVDRIRAGETNQLTARERALCDPGRTRYGMWTQPADFVKLRSASLSFRLPEDWLPGQLRAATVRLQGRNLLTFTDYEGVDPEAFEDGSAEVLFRQEYYNLPPFRSMQLSVKVDF